jgi:4-hydroxybenzoate polyprenyltransferase
MRTDPTTALARFRAYLAERFPIAPYAALVAAFHGAGSLVAVRLGGGEVRAWAGLVVLLAFFHLRVFDEHKDFEKDVRTHPERLLSRGVVTLAMLRRWGVVAIVAEAALAAACGWRALLAWAAMFAFTVAMRFEFGVGKQLEKSLLAYAITHNPVVAGLAMFIWASTGAAWDPRYLLFVAAASFGSLAFEIARKTRLPDEEVPGVDSYSSVYGRRQAGALVHLCVFAAVASAIVLSSRMTASYLPLVPLALAYLAARVLTTGDRPAKKVELGSSVALLGVFFGMGVAAW